MTSSNTSSCWSMDPNVTAVRLRRFMEEEGCFFSRRIATKVMPHMGGGVGIIASHTMKPEPSDKVRQRQLSSDDSSRNTEPHPNVDDEEQRRAGEPGLLVRVPFRTMITVGKARMHLAIVEAEYERQYPLFSAPTATPPRTAPIHTTATRATNVEDDKAAPFTVRFYSEAEPESEPTFRHMCGRKLPSSGSSGKANEGDDTNHAVLSDAHVHHLRQMESKLAASLTPAETLAAYVALQSALHGRLEYDQVTTLPGSSSAKGDLRHAGASATEVQQLIEQGHHRIHFVHDNAWMREWVHALPPLYDNALELQYQRAPRLCPSDTNSLTAPHALPATVRRVLFGFSRYEKKVLKEQSRAYETYVRCLGVLRCLRCLPVGIDMSQGTAHTSRRRGATGTTTGPISFSQFLWCLNTVASRGFGFPVDVWAMMPYVDYFNYALQPNAWMGPVKDEAAAAARRQRMKRNVKAWAGKKKAPSHDNWMTSPLSESQESASDYYFAFKALGKIAKDEQVFLCYGSYSDMELLLWYGFTLRPYLLPLSCISACLTSQTTSGVPAPRKVNVSPAVPYSTTRALLPADSSETERRAGDDDDSDYDELGFLKEQRSDGGGRLEASLVTTVVLSTPLDRKADRQTLVHGIERLLGDLLGAPSHPSEAYESDISRTKRKSPISSPRCGQGLDSLFRAWVAAQRAGEFGIGRESDSPPPALTPTLYAKEKEKWCSALQTCFCFVFSPLENIEGEWDSDEDDEIEAEEEHSPPLRSDHQGSSSSWLHRLVSGYLRHTPLLTESLAQRMMGPSSTTGDDHGSTYSAFTILTLDDAASAVALDHSVRAFATEVLAPVLGLSCGGSTWEPKGQEEQLDPRASPITLEKEAYCGFGCLHPTPDMLKLLRDLSRVLAKAVTCPGDRFDASKAHPYTSTCSGSSSGRNTDLSGQGCESRRGKGVHGTSESIERMRIGSTGFGDVYRVVRCRYEECSQRMNNVSVSSNGRTRGVRESHSGTEKSTDLSASREIAEGVKLVELLRSLCWMEWYHEAYLHHSNDDPHNNRNINNHNNNEVQSPSDNTNGNDNGKRVPLQKGTGSVAGSLKGVLSMCAARRAVQVTDDGATLLYCLAIRLSVTTLLRYLMVIDTALTGEGYQWNSGNSRRSLPRWIHDTKDNEEDSDVEL